MPPAVVVAGEPKLRMVAASTSLVTALDVPLGAFTASLLGDGVVATAAVAAEYKGIAARLGVAGEMSDAEVLSALACLGPELGQKPQQQGLRGGGPLSSLPPSPTAAARAGAAAGEAPAVVLSGDEIET